MAYIHEHICILYNDLTEACCTGSKLIVSITQFFVTYLPKYIYEDKEQDEVEEEVKEELYIKS